MGRSILLWLLGVPIPIIILLALLMRCTISPQMEITGAQGTKEAR